ncbi:MAG: hypothetical protein KDA95_02420, partial [Acidimicrobiales bacterium]|nr:hypothetical protein [Acidimicrobiales bacterium]
MGPLALPYFRTGRERLCMRTLLIEPSSGDHRASELVASTLQESGHEVVRCHERDAPAFPCKGLTHEGCPLEGPPVHAVVAIRDKPTAAPTAQESGITCALRVGLPVVVIGDQEPSPGPLAEWTEVCDDAAALPAAISRAVDAVSQRRAEPLLVEARRVLAIEGVDGGEVTVEVHRESDVAKITVTTEHQLDERVAGIVATRVHAVDSGGA